MKTFCSPSTGQRRAFTLVEILVVVAIVGMLAALLVPVARKGLDRAAMTQDMSNLRDIGQGIATFVGENNGRIPNVSIPLPVNGNSNFMESVDRMMTPDSKFSVASQYNYPRRPVWFSKRYAKMPDGQSYNQNSQYYWGLAWGMNVYLWYNSSPLNGANAFDGYIAKAPDRTRLVLVGEKNRNGGHEFDPRNPAVFADNVQTAYRVSREGRAYYLFGDFHIELIEGDQSIVAKPENRLYSPTNRLYYTWTPQ